LSFMYRYISRESCSQFDSLPLTSLTRYQAFYSDVVNTVLMEEDDVHADWWTFVPDAQAWLKIEAGHGASEPPPLLKTHPFLFDASRKHRLVRYFARQQQEEQRRNAFVQVRGGVRRRRAAAACGGVCARLWASSLTSFSPDATALPLPRPRSPPPLLPAANLGWSESGLCTRSPTRPHRRRHDSQRRARLRDTRGAAQAAARQVCGRGRHRRGRRAARVLSSSLAPAHRSRDWNVLRRPGRRQRAALD
jgi:hypothetical protein